MRIFLGILLILVGLSSLTGISVFNVLFAILLIYIGARILSGHRHFRGFEKHFEKRVTVNENFLNDVVIFSPLNKIVQSQAFEGVRLLLVFAGGTLDMSNVKTVKKTLDFEIVTIFGGGKLILPKGWQVKSENVTILGEVANKTKGAGVTVNLKGTTVFGGMDIVNG